MTSNISTEEFQSLRYDSNLLTKLKAPISHHSELTIYFFIQHTTLNFMNLTPWLYQNWGNFPANATNQISWGFVCLFVLIYKICTIVFVINSCDFCLRCSLWFPPCLNDIPQCHTSQGSYDGTRMHTCFLTPPHEQGKGWVGLAIPSQHRCLTRQAEGGEDMGGRILGWGRPGRRQAGSGNWGWDPVICRIPTWFPEWHKSAPICAGLSPVRVAQKSFTALLQHSWEGTRHLHWPKQVHQIVP